MKTAAALLLAAVAGGIGGCHSVGPATLARDRFDYSAAMTESWKRQMLLNIVKMRYLDPPIFVDVGQIVSSYQLETSVGASAQINRTSSASYANAVGQYRYTDRPTITYTPLTGSRFISGLITPISPSSVFHAIQAGWPASVILRLGATAINGHKSPDRDMVEAPATNDGSFMRVLALIQLLQVNNAVSLRLETDEAKRATTLIALRSPDLSPDLMAASRELRDLLGLDQTATEFKLTYGAVATSNREIALQTRSLFKIMALFSDHVEVPALDLAEGRVVPPRSDSDNDGPGIRIHCTTDVPKEAFVSVNYRNTNFWVDDRDLRTKRAFALIMLFFTLADSSPATNQPVLTIPTS